MRRLDDPILRECQRLVERHEGLTPAFAQRVLGELDRLDAELRDLRQTVDDLTAPKTDKAGKR